MGISSAKTISGGKNKKVHFSFFAMLIWGFNVIVGYSFLISLNGPSVLVGKYLPLLLVMGALISLSCGFAFGKLAKLFNNENGGAFAYVRHTFGHKLGGIVGFFQMLQIPFVSSTVAIGYVWAFTAVKINGHPANSYVLLYLIALIIFIIISFVSKYGFVAHNKIVKSMWAIKWLIILSSIIVALFMLSSLSLTDFKHSPSNPTSHRSLNFLNFMSSAITIFFGYAGFEIVASMCKDMDNSKNSFVKMLVIMIVLIFTFYFFYYFCIIGSVGVSKGVKKGNNPFGLGNGKSDAEYNPINAIFAKALHTKDGKLSFDKSKTSGGAGAIFVLSCLIISQFANKSSGRIQFTWASTRIMSTYAAFGYLPMIFTKQNKYKQFIASYWLEFIISFFLSVIFMALKYATVTYHSHVEFLFSGPLQIISMISFIQYIFVFIIILKLSRMNRRSSLWKKKNKKILKLSMLEKLFYLIFLGVVTLLTVCYFVKGIKDFVNKINHTGRGDISVVVGVILFIILFIASIVLLFFGSKYGWKDNHKKFEHINFKHLSQL